MSVPQRDALAFWREAASGARGDIGLMVPVAELRQIVEMAREAIAMCNTAQDVCGWVGWKCECVNGRCPKCGETITTAGPGTVKAWRLFVAADDLADSAAEPLRMADVDAGGNAD